MFLTGSQNQEPRIKPRFSSVECGHFNQHTDYQATCPSLKFCTIMDTIFFNFQEIPVMKAGHTLGEEKGLGRKVVDWELSPVKIKIHILDLPVICCINQNEIISPLLTLVSNLQRERSESCYVRTRVVISSQDNCPQPSHYVRLLLSFHLSCFMKYHVYEPVPQIPMSYTSVWVPFTVKFLWNLIISIAIRSFGPC